MSLISIEFHKKGYNEKSFWFTICVNQKLFIPLRPK